MEERVGLKESSLCSVEELQQVGRLGVTGSPLSHVAHTLTDTHPELLAVP